LFKKLLLWVILLGGAATGGVAYWAQQPVFDAGPVRPFTIQPGSTLASSVEQIDQAGVGVNPQLLELLARSSLPEDRMARNRIEVERLLNETRTQGFGMAHRARRVSEETSLAIPVRAKDRILATVTVRYAATAVPLRAAVEQFLPRMREVAQKIEAQFI